MSGPGWTPPGQGPSGWVGGPSPAPAAEPPGGWDWVAPPPESGRRLAVVAVGLVLAAIPVAVVAVPLLVVFWGLVLLVLALGLVVLGGVLGLVAASQALRGPRQGRAATLALAGLAVAAGGTALGRLVL